MNLSPANYREATLRQLRRTWLVIRRSKKTLRRFLQPVLQSKDCLDGCRQVRRAKELFPTSSLSLEYRLKFDNHEFWHPLSPLPCVEGTHKTLLPALINSVRLPQQHRRIYMGHWIPGRLGHRESLISGANKCFSNNIEHFCCCEMKR